MTRPVTLEDLAVAFEAAAAALRNRPSLVDGAREQAKNGLIRKGSTESWIAVLGSIAAININELRGATQTEASAAALRGNYDPRGLSGFYNDWLVSKANGRWVTKRGLRWLHNQGWETPKPKAAA